METEELLRLAKMGDERAKEELFLQYRPLLLSRSMIEGQFCEDLFQELSITFLRCIDGFRVDETKLELK